MKTESSATVLSGVVTTGNLWRLELFDRQTCLVSEDRNLYQIPRDLKDVFRILVALAQQ
ncbi:hypothetical protein ACQ4M3_15315 [Leptolyngbya sp. AN03gr2]|uniref:hypothetical protein n=1 Tax=unclassified Leptolyngbya TaxID=2650499 RepID=UPI003D318A2A